MLAIIVVVIGCCSCCGGRCCGCFGLWCLQFFVVVVMVLVMVCAVIGHLDKMLYRVSHHVFVRQQQNQLGYYRYL